MTDRHDYVALEWVKGEIAETLKQARQALEDFVENPQDPTRMRFCLTYIHQVQGTLQMVEFYGAALLGVKLPFIELHLSNTFAREKFRYHSYFSDIAVGCIVGLGALGYELAVQAAAARVTTR